MKLGDIAKSGAIYGEIVNLGPNYVTIVSEGKEHRFWAKDVELTDAKVKRNQLYKESLVFKGYRTKHFNRDLSELFKTITEHTEDEYALLSCIKACDYVAGLDEKSITENFAHAKVNIDRAKRYLKKFDVPVMEAIVKVVDEEMFKYSVLEDLQYVTSDRLMIARVIANVAETPVTGTNPSNIINIAIQKLKVLQMNPQGWRVVGRLLNAATKAGINWNKEYFNPSIRKQMDLI